MMSKTHDYSCPSWGRSVEVLSVSDSGMTAKVLGFGTGVKEGDFLILPNGNDGTTRYRVKKLRHKRPADCWAADIEFQPRARK